ALLVVISLGLGYVTAMKVSDGNFGMGVMGSLISGVIGAVMTVVLVLAIEPLNMRAMFVNASTSLIEILTFEMESQSAGLTILAAFIVGFSVLGGIIYLLPSLPRRAIISGFSAVLVMGMLGELLTVVLGRFDLTEILSDFLYGRNGLSIPGAISIFIFFAVVSVLWATQKDSLQSGVENLPPTQRRTLSWALIVLSIIVLILLPQAVGPYISQILVLVGLYALMGLGLNIEIGLAGLLDLGFVGFFAIGAYTVALMTSTGELGVSGTAIADYSNFWVAIPIAVAVSAFAGIFLGIPVLRMRGDYLAIVTLGFAEIIRILVLSDFLRPLLGGAQGVLNIPKPAVAYAQQIANQLPWYFQTVFFFFVSTDGRIKDPAHFYYIIVIGCALISFVAWRLQNARIGRNWMALREDEDVAEAMGINLVRTKVLAFTLSAAAGGLAGGIFAAKLGTVFPQSFNVFVSINVLSIIIVGGMGSIPGIIVGGIFLVGMPEILREFAEYRLLIYGALLVLMMLRRPEGLIPSAVRRRELQGSDSDQNPHLDHDEHRAGALDPQTTIH
ncbi:MAG: hypothetical protein KDE51_06560, partial [Anaerolineales bacterium]|nr:hypothetical protein [Anaerolineales bacterium]